MNVMGYDMLCVGNNELKAVWDDPASKGMMLSLMRRSRFPWLAANLTWGGPSGEVENAPPIERINMSCSVQDSILSLDSLSGAVRETPFRLQGNVTTRAPEEFAVRLNLSVSDFGTVTGELEPTFKELSEKGIRGSLEETIAEMRKRDQRDRGRKLSPLRKAKDALIIDSTHMSIEEVVGKMFEVARRRISEGEGC